MKRFTSIPGWILAGLLALPAQGHAAPPTFPVSPANINNGTVMPQSPIWPFPQFLEYNYGKSLVNTPPDGLSHAEMEQETIQAYMEMARNFFVAGGWKPAGLPNRLKYKGGCGTDGCAESDGYALLAAVLMADKDSFDGLWVNIHFNIPMDPDYSDATGTVIQNPTYGNGSRCSGGGLEGTNRLVTDNSAADGDVDIAQALLLAWKQWGDNSGYVDAAGRPISYKTEFMSYARGMAAFKPNPMIPGQDWGGDIGIDGYLKGGDSFGEATTWATAAAHPPLYPQACSNCTSSTNCGGNNYLSYLAPGYFQCISAAMDSLGDTVVGHQFWRAAFSSRDIIRQLNVASPTWSVGTNCYTVDDAGNATFMGPWSSVDEGIRTPMRNALDYLWYGQQPYHWDPVSHEALAGAPTGAGVGNGVQRTLASRYAQLLWDPRQPPANNPTFAAQTGLNFWGPSQILDGITTAGAMSGNHIPVVIGPGAMAACAADDLDSLSGVPGRQLTLMKNLWRECFLVWDHTASNPDGTAQPPAGQYFAPAYFHDWFRLQGMLTLAGNWHSACEMVPEANLKLYKAVDKTVAFTGDTLTYWLNYRNYGSVAGGNVIITDPLPSELQPLTANNGGVIGGQTVTWNLGSVPGLQYANVAATEGGVTLTALVRPGTPNGRICNVASISADNGPGWTSNQFPNDISMVYRTNCVDIANRSLALTKTANVGMATFGDTITYTLQVTSSSTAGWIDGGRPQVIPGFSAVLEPWGPMKMGFSIKSEATEPLIDFSNYRFSFYFQDFLYGLTGGAIGTSANQIVANHNANVSGLSGSRTLADFTISDLPVTPGSNAQGAWNQRYVFQMFPGPAVNEWYARKYFNNLGLNWQYGDLASPNYCSMDVAPTANQTEPTTVWAVNGWSWMPGMADANLGTNPPEPIPVSPDRTDPTIAGGVPNNLFDTFAIDTATPYTQVLVEEWDGYVWRRVFGNGPVPNRDLSSVLVTDVLPPELTWGGVSADSALPGTWNAGTSTVSFNVGTLLTNQVVTLKFWATVKPNGGGAGQYPYASFPHDVDNSGCASASTESQVCSDAHVQVLDVPPPTPTPTPGDLKKTVSPATAAAGDSVTYYLNYTNSHGSYYSANMASFADWTNNGYTLSANTFTNASSPANRVDNNVAQLGGQGPFQVEWDLTGENYQLFGVQFLNNGTDKNGFWVDMRPASAATNAYLSVFRDGVQVGSTLTGIPPAGNFTLRITWTPGSPGTLTFFINGLQVLTLATTLPAAGGTKVGMHNGDITGAGGSQFHALRGLRVWSDVAQGLGVWDSLPACLSYVSASPAPASAPAVGANGTVVWGPLANLAYGAGVGLTLVAKVGAGCACGALVNTGLAAPLGITPQAAIAGITVNCGGTPTNTPTLSATPTASPSATPSASPTATPTASPSASPTASPTGTPTPSPSATSSPSPSPSATPSVTATATPSPSPSDSPTLTATGTPSASPSASPSFSATPSVSPSGTPTAVASATATPSISPSATASPSPSSTSTQSPSATATASPTASSTVTPSFSPSNSPSATPSASPSLSATASYTASPVYTATASPSASPTATASPTPTWTATVTASFSPSATPSDTATASVTPSATLTATPTPSFSFSVTASFSPTVTLTRTPSATLTVTVTASRTATATPSVTASATASLTATLGPSFTVSATKAVQFYQQPPLVENLGIYPNPFSDNAQMYFKLRVAAHVTLQFYNVAGEPVYHVEMDDPQGIQHTLWQGINEVGARCASGVYILHFQADGLDQSRGDFWANLVIMR